MGLLSAPGIHLLSGRVGKGQQFDWVAVVGAEDGVIPDFRAKTTAAALEEARILSVMISRARHSVVVTCSARVPDARGRPWDRKSSPYFARLKAARFTGNDGIANFLESAEWKAIAARCPAYVSNEGRLADLDRVGDVLHDKVGKSIRPPISLWISESR